MQVDKQKQRGFILPLALLMMLFVGLVVFTSAQRTGQEAKVAQRDASLVTKQAAAEAGFYTLRQQVNKTISGNGGCTTKTTIETVCECLKDKSLKAIMTNDVGGYPGKEVSYGEEVGGQQVKWWFKDTSLEDFKVYKVDEVCRIAARVFVGNPDDNPDYFMSADIEIEENIKIKTKSPGLNKLLENLINGLDIPLKTLNDLLDNFYKEDLDFEDDENISLVSVSSNKTLDESAFVKDKINLVVVSNDSDLIIGEEKNKGKLNNIKLDGVKIIIISNDAADIKLAFKGAQGLIIAPKASVNLNNGMPHTEFDTITKDCGAGKHGKTCNHPKGGGSFSGFDIFDPKSGFMEQLNPGGTGAGVVLKESVKMDFNY